MNLFQGAFFISPHVRKLPRFLFPQYNECKQRGRSGFAITCEEAAAYSGIGIKRLRKMALAKGCNFSISNGTQILINREKFDKYMDKIEKV